MSPDRSAEQSTELEDSVPNMTKITGNRTMPGFTASNSRISKSSVSVMLCRASKAHGHAASGRCVG
jgi:hypothetical protein